MWAILLLACAESDTELVPEPLESSHAEVSIEFTPTSMDFGAVGVGSPASETLTVANTGTANLLIGGMGSSRGDLEVTNLNTLLVPPGGSTQLLVTWTPEETGAIEALIYLELGSNPAEFETLSLDVVGRAEGTELYLSADTLDFGDVAVGCDAELGLTLTNRGTVPITVNEVELVETRGLELSSPRIGLDALPLLMTTGGYFDLSLYFAPDENRSYDTVLRVTTDDPLQPQIDIPVLAEGRIAGRHTLNYTVNREDWQYTTALFHVNEVAINGMASSAFRASLPTLFDVLLDSNIPFRVAFFLENNGQVYGSVPYIDESFTASEATSAALAMLGNSSAYNDHDQNLSTLDNALRENQSWVLDEDEDWERAKLNMVAINNDIEQSNGHWSQYVSTWQSYKADSADVVVHAIGGDVPRGCAGADPFTAFYEASQATGGTFASVCSTDWTGHMETLGEAMLGSGQHFELDGQPLVDTIEVFVDGSAWRSGWSYDAEYNEIDFDSGSFPRFGSDVRITYLTSVECD